MGSCCTCHIPAHNPSNPLLPLNENQTQEYFSRTKPEEGRNVPVTVPDRQMDPFIAACNTYNEKMTFISPDEINLSEGTRVRIAGGTFDGVEGTFVRVEKGRQKHVVVLVEGIVAVVLAKVSDGYIQVLED